MPFLILVPREDLPTDESELTYQFVLRTGALDRDPGELYLNELWIAISQGSATYIWCKLSVNAVEELREDNISIGYLLSGETEMSDYLFRLGQAAEKFRIDNLSWIRDVPLNKVVGIPSETIEALRAVLDKSCPVRMVSPKLSLVSHFPLGTADVPCVMQFRALVQQLKREYTTSELYKCSKYPALNPFEALAYYYFESKRPDLSETLYEAVNPNCEGSTAGQAWRRIRTVDIGLRKVIPDRVKARRFINPPQNHIDALGEDLILKTDRAEASHQKILADLSSRALYLGLTPYETNSMDLYIEGKKGCIVIEIKSATQENFYRQCLKGAIQATEYSYALRAYRDASPKAAVVIERQESEQLEGYCRGLLNYMGIGMLSYRETLSWPERVLGFDRMIENTS